MHGVMTKFADATCLHAAAAGHGGDRQPGEVQQARKLRKLAKATGQVPQFAKFFLFAKFAIFSC